jgi:DNA-binding MarR family transcriptional regulator
MRADSLILALTAFPKLRFYFPDITARHARGLVISHEAACILSLIDAFTVTQGYASQAHVRSILGFPQDRFSQILRPLLRACVDSERDPDDGRNRRLTLTKIGRAALTDIKLEYETIMTDQLSGLENDERIACVRVIKALTATAWHQLEKIP